MAAGIAVAILAGGIVTRRRMRSRAGTRRVNADAVSAARDTAPPTLVLAPDGRLRFANKTAGELLGYAAAVLASTSLRELVSQAELHGDPRIGRRPPGAVAKLDSRLRMADGAWLPGGARGREPGRRTRPVLGLVVSIHDVSPLEDARGEADPAGLPRFADSACRTGPCSSIGWSTRSVAAGDTPEGTAVLFVDLDDFKTVNDALGHVEARLRSWRWSPSACVACVRPEDTAGRLGGDEFAILLDDVDEEDASVVAAASWRPSNAPFVLPSSRSGSAAASASPTARPGLTPLDRHAAGRRRRDVPRQGDRQEPVPHCSSRRCRTPRATGCQLERGHARRARARRVHLHYQPIVDLPDGDHRRRSRRSSAGTIPERGLITPGRVHPDRREDGADGPDRRVRRARGLPAGARLAVGTRRRQSAGHASTSTCRASSSSIPASSRRSASRSRTATCRRSS